MQLSDLADGDARVILLRLQKSETRQRIRDLPVFHQDRAEVERVDDLLAIYSDLSVFGQMVGVEILVLVDQQHIPAALQLVPVGDPLSDDDPVIQSGRKIPVDRQNRVHPLGDPVNRRRAVLVEGYRRRGPQLGSIADPDIRHPVSDVPAFVPGDIGASVILCDLHPDISVR